MVRAQRRKFHYIYKITRFDGAYYIGLHSTDNLEDGYFGSGKRLWHSIHKHGKDKHTKEILEFLPDRESLLAREKDLVCRELLEDAMCLNIAIGGQPCGFHSEEQKKKAWQASIATRRASDTYKEYHKKRSSATMKRFHAEGKISYDNFKGKTHSDETKLKIGAANSKHQQGKNNSQFGTCWVSNGTEVKKIDKDNLESYIAKGYQRGRKFIP